MYRVKNYSNKTTVQKAGYIMASEERRTKSTEELINTLNDFCSQILIMAEAKGLTRKEVKRVQKSTKGRRNNNDNKSSHDNKPRGLYSNAIYENIRQR